MLNVSDILAQFFQLWWLLPIAAIILFVKSSFGKGVIGEAFLNLVINIKLDKKKYQLLRDVTLYTEDGTTQIDHIIVSQYGIFVVETKNMKGWIFGGENQKFWTQNIYKKKHTFQNPLYQNYKHTKTLEKLLDLDSTKIFSVVVFVGDATFKTDMPENVVYPRGLFRFIDSHNEVLFTPREMWRIVEDIEDGRLSKGFKTHREHVSNVKTRVNEKKTQSNVLICPRCSSNLVLRVAKKGANVGNEFYGCYSYPKCKFTRTI
ncbi:NERD domain-containing protein [Sulfurimonas sp.]|uniref:NERD domain-containing protein n=1 Tax=Sulfurimonas sp. TaxID=2022749 RepID=UPI001A079280|nr:NERD domain-containing protein [Sulfurimonas sp.]MBE0513926.1 NERD domain-containing protein [Sulfurimonas sp.]